MPSDYLLKKNHLPLSIEIHSDPLSGTPTALTTTRAFKKNKLIQISMEDNKGGAEECLLCNPEKLDQQPTPVFHLDNKVMSFPNSAPYLPGDQRVLALWHKDKNKRYKHAHKFQLEDFGVEEFYFLTAAAAELAEKFPDTTEGQALQQDPRPIRCVAGFNLGSFAGQSLPHFHLQYGWDLAVDGENRKLSSEALALYYTELGANHLVLFNDSDLRVIVPWTPKGNLHLELHIKNKHELRELDKRLIAKVSHVAQHILSLYLHEGLRNVNILFASSPYLKRWQPLVIHFVPRGNVPALYEMIGVNVVDTPPDHIRMVFEKNTRWSDVMKNAEERASLVAEEESNLYARRFDE